MGPVGVVEVETLGYLLGLLWVNNCCRRTKRVVREQDYQCLFTKKHMKRQKHFHDVSRKWLEQGAGWNWAGLTRVTKELSLMCPAPFVFWSNPLVLDQNAKLQLSVDAVQIYESGCQT